MLFCGVGYCIEQVPHTNGQKRSYLSTAYHRHSVYNDVELLCVH